VDQKEGQIPRWEFNTRCSHLLI